MQTTQDGEYIPAKELDFNFKIPKKQPSNDEASHSQQNVMVNSYYNTTPEPAPVGPVVAVQVEAAQNLILQSLQKRNHEKPKLYANHIRKTQLTVGHIPYGVVVVMETIPDCYDDSLPRELTSLFQPLYCKLCSAQLSSNVVAKLHYKSKNHEKKIRNYLCEYSERTGEPLHKRARMAAKPKEGEQDEANPLHYYCDVCDLPLTGKLHAESHYMGKNHRKATLGVKTPAGKGHYTADGKWVRQGSSHKRPNPDPHDDGFGADFRTEPASATSVGFRCDLCSITTTCQEQLESHYNGQKHRKKLKQQRVDGAGVVMADVEQGDCSVYRTPSGQYYCQICNCSSNSEVQFRQHLQSKSHLKKASQKK